LFKVVHYRDKCIGCGICFERQPHLWRMSKKDGKAVLLNAADNKKLFILEVPEIEKELTREIVKACPARVIKIM